MDLFHELYNNKMSDSINEENPSESSLPRIILIGGGWSSGKSTSAIAIAQALGIANVIHTDIIRATLRNFSHKNKQCLNLATYNTWQLYSKYFSKDTLVNGFEKQCRAVMPGIIKCINEAVDFGKDTVIEGMHLLPRLYSNYAAHHNIYYFTLYVNRSEFRDRIRKRCTTTYKNRDYEKYLEHDKYTSIMALNDALASDAKKYLIPLFDLNEVADVKKLVALLFEFWNGSYSCSQ